MEYITARQASELWQTSVRWVQLCCKSGAVATALPALPQGLRFFSCHITAHQAYLEGDYNRSLGITQAALAVAETTYPSPPSTCT